MGTLRYVMEFVIGTAVRFAPLFFLSIGLAAVVKSLPIARVASRWLARREHASVVAGSALGAFSPFCSCTVVPVVRSLLVAGAPLAGVMAFWVASPLMDPEIFLLSVGLLGWDIAVTRLVAALALALLAGFGAVVAVRRGWLPDRAAAAGGATAPRAAARTDRRAAVPAAVDAPVLVGAGGGAVSSSLTVLDQSVAAPAADEDACCGATADATADVAVPSGGTVTSGGTVPPAVADRDSGCGDGACTTGGATDDEEAPRGVVATLRALDWSQVRADFLAESWHIGRWILLAFAIEALILRYVPQEALITVLGNDAPWAVPLAALLGVPLYLDNMSALPIISGLLEQGMAPGAAIAFLLAGPVTTIPAMTAVRAVLPGPVFRYYLAVSLFGSMALGAVANLLL